jgi:ABC-type multidrug transport system ATPase subunit
VLVGGLVLPEHAADVRRYVGLVAHQTFLYDELTVRENLLFYGRLYGVADIASRVDSLVEHVGLAHRGDARVRTLSRGLQQRASLARAVLHDPPILLLDEPETGLDVAGADLLEELMRDRAGRRRTVLVTTHNLERALELADRVVVLAAGKVSLDLASAQTSRSEITAAIRVERGSS